MSYKCTLVINTQYTRMTTQIHGLGRARRHGERQCNITLSSAPTLQMTELKRQYSDKALGNPVRQQHRTNDGRPAPSPTARPCSNPRFRATWLRSVPGYQWGSGRPCRFPRRSVMAWSSTARGLCKGTLSTHGLGTCLAEGLTQA
jgi:hypothetical protein